MSRVTLDIADGLARLTMTRPEKRNALDAAMMDALTAALREAETTARVVLLSGAGPVFCAGADLDAVAGLHTETQVRDHADRLGGLFATLADLAIPSICVVTGSAIGAGCGLVCASDLAIAAPNARLGFPEFARGLLPALVIPPLVAAIGQRRAMHAICAEDLLSAEEARQLGIVTRVCDDPAQAALATARHLCLVPPDRLGAARTLLRTAATAPTADARRHAIEANIADRGKPRGQG